MDKRIKTVKIILDENGRISFWNPDEDDHCYAECSLDEFKKHPLPAIEASLGFPYGELKQKI